MNRRIKSLRKAIRKLGIQAFFVTNPTNFRYLTGLSVSNGAVLVTLSQAIVFIDKRYSEMASERASSDFIILDSAEMMPRLQRLRTVGIESDSVSVDQYERWRRLLKNTKLVQVSSLIKGLRRVKDIEEKRKILRACSITKSVLRIIPTLLRPGITELALADLIESECLKRGADGMAFDTIVGFGEHTSRPHHRPTSRKYRTGEIVQIDMGARYQGYCSDYSRFFSGTSASADILKALRALKEAKKIAETMIVSGARLHDLDRAARMKLAEYGYGEEFCHALGHGLGLEIHEGVTISTKRPDDVLQAGEFITIEPGLYFPGLFGIRLEDTYVVPFRKKR